MERLVVNEVSKPCVQHLFKCVKPCLSHPQTRWSRGFRGWRGVFRRSRGFRG